MILLYIAILFSCAFVAQLLITVTSNITDTDVLESVVYPYLYYTPSLPAPVPESEPLPEPKAKPLTPRRAALQADLVRKFQIRAAIQAARKAEASYRAAALAKEALKSIEIARRRQERAIRVPVATPRLRDARGRFVKAA